MNQDLLKRLEAYREYKQNIRSRFSEITKNKEIVGYSINVDEDLESRLYSFLIKLNVEGKDYYFVAASSNCGEEKIPSFYRVSKDQPFTANKRKEGLEACKKLLEIVVSSYKLEKEIFERKEYSLPLPK